MTTSDVVVRCPDCGASKDASEFYSRDRYCRECRRDRDLLRRFGVTPERYAQMLQAQADVCAICRKPETVERNGRVLRLAVDHDHSCCAGDSSCGACVRALICTRCNRGIGTFGDDPAALRAAADYVEAHRVLVR